ncbi:hypothetical protein Q3G72_004284 [Acer saccharum]|nr:hypothetical protein Q3G72_004284 [Acer saccharum]
MSSEDTETQPQPVKIKDNDQGTDQEKNLRERKISATRLRHVDSLNLEAGRIGNSTGRPVNVFLSAVSGIKSLGQDAVMWISIVILILLFAVQRYGTDKVGASFAPIILLWFALNAGIGLYNLFAYDITVLRAFYPKYIFDYFSRNGKQAWISLGGVILCITGNGDEVALLEEEVEFVQKAMDKGVVYLLGEANVTAESNSSVFKKFVVNYLYHFLKNNFRQGENHLTIPQGRLLRVGMTYEI